jgi:hypothetical protein
MSTLSASVNKVVSEGYRECFKVTSRGLYSTSRSRYYRPEQVQIVDMHRFDTQGNPGDNAIMYIVETSDGLKGTLIDAYSHSDTGITQFINEVEDIRSKMNGQRRNFC